MHNTYKRLKNRATVTFIFHDDFLSRCNNAKVLNNYGFNVFITKQ